MEGGVCNCVTTWGRREGGDYSFIPAAEEAAFMLSLRIYLKHMNNHQEQYMS